MVLIDSSVWIDHVRRPIVELSDLLRANQALSHEWVILELQCGSWKDRKAFIQDLLFIPRAPALSLRVMARWIEHNELYGRGCGFVDLGLLHATVTAKAKLWTHDKRLHALAESLGVAYKKTGQ
jgi:predicted nucleic acid-binding protein